LTALKYSDIIPDDSILLMTEGNLGRAITPESPYSFSVGEIEALLAISRAQTVPDDVVQWCASLGIGRHYPELDLEHDLGTHIAGVLQDWNGLPEDQRPGRIDVTFTGIRNALVLMRGMNYLSWLYAGRQCDTDLLVWGAQQSSG
jgi:hypothetical protein